MVIKMLTELRRLMDEHRTQNEVKELYFENCKTSVKEDANKWKDVLNS